MNFKTLKYKKIKEILIKNDKSTLENIQQGIKMAVYTAMIGKENMAQKFQVIEDFIVNVFELEEVLDNKEIDYIFEMIAGSKKQEEELFNITLKDIQILFIVNISNINDIELKYAIIELLEQISLCNDKENVEEIAIINTYIELLNSEQYLELYTPVLKKIDEHNSEYLYNRQGLNPATFYKKLPKALSAYADGIKEEDVLALYDSTIFGGASEGFLVTNYGIITTQDEDFSVIPFAMIYSVVYDKKGMSFFSKPNEDNKTTLIGYLPRFDNLRGLSNIFNRIAKINASSKPPEEANNKNFKISKQLQKD